MYTLYYSPNACSLAIHALLHSLNVPFEAKQIATSKGEQFSAEFQKINPRAQVPVLVVDGKETIREGAAIIMWLCEKHQSNWLPAAGTPTRAKALEWVMYLNSSLHPKFGTVFKPDRYTENKDAQQELKQNGYANIQKGFDEIEEQLGKTPYLCGNDFTVADVLCAVIARWTNGFNGAVKLGSKTQALVKTVEQNPAFQKAVTAESAESQKKAA